MKLLSGCHWRQTSDVYFVLSIWYSSCLLGCPLIIVWHLFNCVFCGYWNWRLCILLEHQQKSNMDFRSRNSSCLSEVERKCLHETKTYSDPFFRKPNDMWACYTVYAHINSYFCFETYRRKSTYVSLRGHKFIISFRCIIIPQTFFCYLIYLHLIKYQLAHA